MRLFKTLLLAGATQANDFEVIRCNNLSTNATEMTIRVDGDYMETHHDALKGTFTFDGTDYTKIVNGADLTLDLTNSTYIYLDYELVTAQTAIAGTSGIHFAGRTTGFRCKYPRAVNVGDSYTVQRLPDPSPFELEGFLQYDFTSSVANGRTTAVIAPQHGLPSLEANVQNCTVTYGNMSVYPVRFQSAWADSDVCIDNRIDTTFTYANGGATVDWRTFHFNDQNTATSQTHEIECSIRASEVLSVSSPSNCNCFDQQACLRTNGVCQDRIWHGDETEVQTNFASLTIHQPYTISNMFDNDLNTFWHSTYPNPQVADKTLRIEFPNPIDFEKLVIHTRHTQGCATGHCANRYNNACLVLDDNVNQQLCTDTDYGWSHSPTPNSHQPIIEWLQPTQSVRVVSLVFRGPRDGQVNDLKIHYTECGPN